MKGVGHYFRPVGRPAGKPAPGQAEQKSGGLTERTLHRETIETCFFGSLGLNEPSRLPLEDEMKPDINKRQPNISSQKRTRYFACTLLLTANVTLLVSCLS